MFERACKQRSGAKAEKRQSLYHDPVGIDNYVGG